jgi:hypothetical protein
MHKKDKGFETQFLKIEISKNEAKKIERMVIEKLS